VSVISLDVLNITPFGRPAVLEPEDLSGDIAGESILVERIDDTIVRGLFATF
jgi:hypothetical protein